MSLRFEIEVNEKQAKEKYDSFLQSLLFKAHYVFHFFNEK